MAITGLHTIIDSGDVDADLAFFRDVLGFAFVDAGNGRLFFAAPPTEIGFHPGSNDKHEVYLMCDDVEAEIARLQSRGIGCAPVTDMGWGLLTTIRMPGGGDLGLYQPRHATAHGGKSAPRA